MCASDWFGCLLSQVVHVVEKSRHVFIESGGECRKKNVMLLLQAIGYSNFCKVEIL
jgi:hypothetical protein